MSSRSFDSEEVSTAVVGIAVIVGLAIFLGGAAELNRKKKERREAELARRYTVIMPSGDRYAGLQMQDAGLGWVRYRRPGGEVVLVEGPHAAVEETQEVEVEVEVEAKEEGR
jgi:hypothetical protein